MDEEDGKSRVMTITAESMDSMMVSVPMNEIAAMEEVPTEVIEKRGIKAWEFPGYGEEVGINFKEDDNTPGIFGSITGVGEELVVKLGQLKSTAICGNDITASCLYTAGFCAAAAGVYAFVSLLMVALVLFLFRSVYGEVGSALPMNGGTYTVLLNTTTKSSAAIAGALSFMSYAATSVVSGAEAIMYGSHIFGDVNVAYYTIVLLAFFCLLNLLGISESAKVAVVIFLLHMLTLSILVVVCAIYFGNHLDLFTHNWSVSNSIPHRHGVFVAIMIGFGSGMLGITGFETSANFIEEQKPGVFPKTLRNMWILVTIFNPTLSLLSLGVLTNDEIYDHTGDLLAIMGRRAGGEWLHVVVCVDAFLVLAGSILTGYVGVTGLLARLTLDRCLPQVLLSKNPITKTHHFIIIGFFIVCSSMILIVRGDVATLEGVYTVSFLSVMALFAIGNMILKYKRGMLPRGIRAAWPTVVIAFLGVTTALCINVSQNPDWVYYFLIYFLVTLFVLFLMFQRVQMVKFFLYFSTLFLRSLRKKRCLKVSQGEDESAIELRWKKRVARVLQGLKNQRIIFFTKSGKLSSLNKAILYIRSNEQAFHILFVHFCVGEGDDDDAMNCTRVELLRQNVDILNRCYPKLRIDLILIRGVFTPENVQRLSQVLGVPKNFMFIRCPNDRPLQDMKIKISDFKGVRVITGGSKE
eukprot:TRINITY_DN11659_c0_g1_i1.p1 TRINITY_DN11659_c0_g1~~TRINITY_DN11659_c0_g1_i1.p1  ORF type:complete len:785 (-),score=157.20 TRINITY_DN11659_c0_g1_i1:138-2216(-)